MDIILLLKTVLLGIVEGITEWLPISSTGHLILADEFIKLNMTGAFKEMFDVVIQLGAIMAVVVLYFHKLNPFSPKKNHREKMDTIVLWTKVILAVFPAAIIGILFDDWLNAHFYNPPVVAAMLIIYGILFIIIENRNKRTRRRPMNDLTRLSYGMALGIGVFQVLALIPGTSRSGATILGGILLGCSRTVAAEFSFFLGIPVMFGASFLKIFKFLAKGNTFGSEEIIILLTGSIVAFVVSIIAIKFLLNYLKKNDFTVFGWYRVILGAILIGYWLFS